MTLSIISGVYSDCIITKREKKEIFNRKLNTVTDCKCGGKIHTRLHKDKKSILAGEAISICDKCGKWWEIWK
jgi:hypothetical protein